MAESRIRATCAAADTDGCAGGLGARARSMKKLLVANRGEIARRVIHTAHAMGIATVAVHSDPDAQALHVREATHAVALGGAASADSYLRGDKLLAAARATGADALHPGYGFLSENADFAQAVLDAGLLWVGPPPAAIRALGNKAAAKALAAAHAVPCLPGYAGADQSPEGFAAQARRPGYPLLGKAVAGRGGRGAGDRCRAVARRAGRCALGGAGRFWLRRFADRARAAAPAPSGGAGLCRRAWRLHPPGRARLLGAAAPPETHRRMAQPGRRCRAARAPGRLRRRIGARCGLCGRGHGGVFARGGAVFSAGDEHPPAGGAPGDRSTRRAGPGGVAVARGARRAAGAGAAPGGVAGPCDRSAAVRRRRAISAAHRARAALEHTAGHAVRA